jgi:hypothetical protein
MIVEEGQDGLTSQKPPRVLEESDAAGTVGEIIGECPGPAVQANQPIIDGA